MAEESTLPSPSRTNRPGLELDRLASGLGSATWIQRLTRRAVLASLERLETGRLELVDESARHAGHAGARPEGESHFGLTVVAAAFAGHGRLARQRMVYAALGDLMDGRVHALSIRALTPEDREVADGTLAAYCPFLKTTVYIPTNQVRYTRDDVLVFQCACEREVGHRPKEWLRDAEQPALAIPEQVKDDSRLARARQITSP